MEKIEFFKGAKKDFIAHLKDSNVVDDEYVPFMELIREYNTGVRANDASATDETDQFEKGYITNVVIYADDFASVADHVITNFSNIVLLGHNITNVYIQNPPKRVEYSLRAEFPDEIIQTIKSNYYNPNQDDVIRLFKSFDKSLVVGQLEAKRQTAVALFKKSRLNNRKPSVLMFFGPSGIGKTELSKYISEFYQGELTRIQFSMMQTEEAYKYVFGDQHGKPSLAQDLLARESNIVLLDEFDKVNPAIYNAFYQMFDEGEYEDINYQVDVSNCVFILTSNFQSENEIAERIGLPIYSRLDAKIKFLPLSIKETQAVINNCFDQVRKQLSSEEIEVINKLKLQEGYLAIAKKFKNVRMLDKFIENDVYSSLFDAKVHDDAGENM